MAAPRRAFFTVVNPSGQRSRAGLTATPFFIGRQPGNQLVLRDNRVSRVHAQVSCDGGEYYLHDESSRHGLFLNGERIARARLLRPGDTVTFGFPDAYQLIFGTEESGLPSLIGQMSGGANLAKLRSLLEVARALQAALSTTEILETVVDAALSVTGSERGFLLLRDNGGLAVRVARDARGAMLSERDMHIPRTLIERALAQRRDLLSMNFAPGVDGEAGADASAIRLDLRSVICIPLVRARPGVSDDTIAGDLDETVGVLYLDSRAGPADLSTGNRELLQTLAIEASTILENARLLEQDRQHRKVEQELEIARDIQQSLLPRSLPSSGWLRAAGSSIPTHQVGGDFFDMVRIHPDCWSLAVADVSGKGVSSALLASLLQGGFLMTPESAAGITGMLAHLNRYVYDRAQGEKYATVFYAAIFRDGLLRWANAGHCPPVLHGPSRTTMLPANSMPVGMLEDVPFEAAELRLEPGDRLVFYSDGLTDALNYKRELFGEARLRKLLRESSALSAEQTHARILAELRDFTGGMEQADDVTLLVLEYCPGEGD